MLLRLVDQMNLVEINIFEQYFYVREITSVWTLLCCKIFLYQLGFRLQTNFV